MLRIWDSNRPVTNPGRFQPLQAIFLDMVIFAVHQISSAHFVGMNTSNIIILQYLNSTKLHVQRMGRVNYIFHYHL